MGVINLFKKKIKIYGIFLLEGKDVILSEFTDKDIEEKSVIKAAGLIDEMLKITGRDNIMSIFVSSSENNLLIVIDGNITIGVVVDKNEIPGKVEFEVSDVKDKLIEEGRKTAEKKREKEEVQAKEVKEKVEGKKEEKIEKKEESKEKVETKEDKKKEEKKEEKKPEKKTIKKPSKIEDFDVPSSVMDELFNIAEEYLMDFVDDVWDNNIEEYNVDEKNPTYRKIMAFIEGMEESTSMILGHTVGEEMGQRMRDVLKKYKK